LRAASVSAKPHLADYNGTIVLLERDYGISVEEENNLTLGSNLATRLGRNLFGVVPNRYEWFGATVPASDFSTFHKYFDLQDH
jgi:hypothetical protein